MIESDPLEYSTAEIKSRSKVGGLVVYDYIRATDPASKKVLFIIPGVSCDITELAIKATCKKAV